MLLEPDTQIEFAQKKGSIPVRLDRRYRLAGCLRAEGVAVADQDPQMPANGLLSPPALTGAMEDVISQYWNNPAMTADAFIAKVAELLKQL